MKPQLKSYQLLRVKGSDSRGIHSLSVMDKKTLRKNGFSLSAVRVACDDTDPNKPVSYLVVACPSYWNCLFRDNTIAPLSSEMAYVISYRTSIFKKRIFAVKSIPDEADNCVMAQELGYTSVKGLGKVYYAIETQRFTFFRTLSTDPSRDWEVTA